MNKIYILIALLAAPLVAAAQHNAITLERCREMAIESSLELKSSRSRLSASEDILQAYRANRLPSISLSGGYLYSTATLSETIQGGYLPTFTPDLTTGEMIPNIAGTAADGTPIFSSYAYMPDMNFDIEVGSVFNAGVKAVQSIYMGGKVSTATKLAQVGVDAATIERARSEADVILAADEAFYTYLKVKEMVLSADAYYTTVEEFYRQVESLHNRGMCTKSDLMKVQVQLNDAELKRMKARNGLVLSRMNLCYIVGLPLATLQVDVVDTFDMEHSVDRALDVTSRPEFELLAKSIEAKELEVKLAQSDFKPSISALAAYSYTNGVKINGVTALNSSPSFTGGVMVNIPIFHWGEGRRKVSAARHEVSIAENTREDLVQKMTLELMQSINTYTESRARVALTERTVEQAEESLRQSGKQYAVGMETLSAHLEAQAMWQKAMSDLVEARADQRIAYARYCRSRGV